MDKNNVISEAGMKQVLDTSALNVWTALVEENKKLKVGPNKTGPVHHPAAVIKLYSSYCVTGSAANFMAAMTFSCH